MRAKAAERGIADPERLVAVASFADPLRAQMAKGLLQSAGIECFLQGEHVNQMLAPAFRARLRVLAADAAEARELLGAVDAPVLLAAEQGEEEFAG